VYILTGTGSTISKADNKTTASSGYTYTFPMTHLGYNNNLWLMAVPEE
jgi:hypothetical protein